MTSPRLTDALAALREEVKAAEETLARLAESGAIDEQLAAAAEVHAARLRLRRDGPRAEATLAREAGSAALASLFEAPAPEPHSEPASGAATAPTGDESGSTEPDSWTAQVAAWDAADAARSTDNSLTD